jgi:hypothetical protein
MLDVSLLVSLALGRRFMPMTLSFRPTRSNPSESLNANGISGESDQGLSGQGLEFEY